jgi:hypothetical protein
MPEIITSRVLYPDSITLGTPGKGGEIKVYFDSGDLTEAQKRVDNAVQVRQHLLNRLTEGGQRV